MKRGDGGALMLTWFTSTRAQLLSTLFKITTMSISRCFSIVGDSNIKRHMNPTNCRDRPLMSGCQVLPCGKLSLLSECLRSIRAETNVCLLACVSNFLADSEDTGGSVGFRVEPVLLEVLSLLTSAASENPDRAYLLAPPMYRRSPLWYRDGLPEVLTKFSSSMKIRPSNLHLMSSFATPEFIDDGVHLTPYSGLEYVLHLFDNAGSILDALTAEPSEIASRHAETSRVLEDRMMALEQDHHRLSLGVESKTAEDSELFDYQENIRYEGWFVIAGLKRLPEGMAPRDWQVQAKADVSGVLTTLMNRDIPIVVVKNSTGRGKDSITTYNVQLQKLEDSKEVRDKFGGFFVGGNHLPDSLKGISIKNRVTPATLVRISILKVLGARYLASNPGAKVKVISYEPRPTLKLTPPQGSTDSASSRVMVYDYIQAIKNLPTNFTKEERDSIVQRVSHKLHGKLRSLFLVISDDMIKKRPKGAGPSASRSSKRGASPAAGNSEKQRK